MQGNRKTPSSVLMQSASPRLVSQAKIDQIPNVYHFQSKLSVMPKITAYGQIRFIYEICMQI